MPAVTDAALAHVRICDFTGQLAGAGATKFLAAFGAQVIRIEDPLTEGRWDILRGSPPFKEGQRGLEAGSGFNNHNVNKLGITLNLRTDRGRELLAELVRCSDAVTENFAAGVLERWGFGYSRLRELRPDILYVSNCGFGQRGPYGTFKSWGPIAQAVSGLTFTSGLADQPPAGWGYSYMDHTGGYYMAMAILAGLFWRARSGQGQWIDLSCTEAGAGLHGPALLDAEINGRPMRRAGSPDSNRNQWPPMAPHGIYPTIEEDGPAEDRPADDRPAADNWVAISVVDDSQWARFSKAVDEPWVAEDRWVGVAGRLSDQDELDALVRQWTARQDRFELAERLRRNGVAAAPVQRPAERIDGDPATDAWGLWPLVDHPVMGEVRVDGLPVHLSGTDWSIERAAPCLGQHNDEVYGGLLGLSDNEIAGLRAEGVI